MKHIELSGMRFGRWLVVDRFYADQKPAKYTCRCDCGTLSSVLAGNLRSGKTKSCGCLRKETSTKHGMWGTPIYMIWNSMLQRCHNPNDKAYKYYGDRGIKVCSRWHNFEKFYFDVGDPPEKKTIERINNNEGYFLSNFKWATRKEQSRNTRKTIYLEHNGLRLSLNDWSDKLGVPKERIRGRLRRGWDTRDALAS